jgi:plastocyanin
MKTTLKTTFRTAGIIQAAIAALGIAASASGATNFVTVQGFSFSPKNLTIAVGDTVVFTGGNNSHTVTGDGAEPFCGNELFIRCSVTFSSVGTFAYHCIPHLSRGMTGVIRVVEAVTSPLTVIVHGPGTVTPDLNGQALLVGGSFTITATPAPGITFTGWTGGLTSSAPRLTFVMQKNLVLEANFVDATAPAVIVTAPSANARLTNSTVRLEGTTTDGNAVAAVEFRVENMAGPGAFQAAEGTSSWSAVVSDLVPGTNRFHVRARDVSGNISPETVRNVILLTSLTVTTNGNGAVSAGFIGTSYRDPGVRLNLLATANSGFVFSQWTGNIESSANPLGFVPASNIVLQANFVPNPLLPVSGTYNGLFYVRDDPNGVQHESSGAFAFRLLTSGKHSGQLQLAGKRLPFSGQFGVDGKSTNAVNRPGTNALLMELMLDLSNGSDRVMGRVINPVAGWISELTGDRAPIYTGTNASPYSGNYTLLVTKKEDPNGAGIAQAVPEPEIGNGFGTLKVDAKGKVTLRASLADGTPVTQTVSASKDGVWPLYLALYRGKGSILSWVNLRTNPAPEASLRGELSWIKPAMTGVKYYPAGFTNQMDMVGSIYPPPGTNQALQIGTGAISFDGGNLGAALTNIVNLEPNNKVRNLTTNQPLTMSIALPTGLFSGSVKVDDGGVKKTLAFKGAVLQRQNLGAGFFLGTNESGSVLLAPLP